MTMMLGIVLQGTSEPTLSVKMVKYIIYYIVKHGVCKESEKEVGTAKLCIAGCDIE